MRLLIVSQYFWPEGFRINDLVVWMRERGHKVDVLTGMPNYPTGRRYPGYRFFRPAEEWYHGARVVRVPLLVRGRAGSLALVANYLSFAFSASVIGPFRCRARYDAIFVFEPSPVTVGLPAIVLRWCTGAPIAFWVQDLWPESLSATGRGRSSLALFLVGRLVRFIYRRCHRVLVQSEGFRDAVVARGARPDTVDCLPNWAESLYRPAAATPGDRSKFGLPEGFCVMFAGNLGTAQSLETILDAAQRLHGEAPVQWLILGTGHRESWLRDQIAARGLEDCMQLLGQHPAESMPAYFAIADVLLVTLRRDPTFAITVPSKIQSYLACGRPVVGAIDGEGARIIEQANAGLTTDAEDAEGLAAAVLKLFRMPVEERERLGANGREYFLQHFERELLLTRLEKWLESMA